MAISYPTTSLEENSAVEMQVSEHQLGERFDAPTTYGTKVAGGVRDRIGDAPLRSGLSSSFEYDLDLLVSR
jgi:hypothetical protein